MVPTPARVKRDPRWPKEWQVDWETCEAHAVPMVNPQDNPVESATATAMREAYEEIEESSPSLVKHSVNFTHEKEPDSNGLEPCVACGNCLSGCPHNAKKSNDKNYIALAIQASTFGWIILHSEVQYIVKVANEDYSENGDINGKQCGRRWHIYFDNLEYIAANFVILSAGVLGTTQILFQSERRGLKVSERLGFGFSSNGNNVAYLDGSSVPINGQGLKKAEFSKIPLQDRAGPTISSSYTSSVGFTIQSAIIPTVYPHLLLKGIATYGWPNNYWLLHDVIDKLKYTIGVNSSKGMILNSMGYDSGNGRITLDKSTEKINFTTPDDPLLPRKVKALQRITKRLGGNLFMSRYRSMSVHL
ncbi:hypothetical protein MRB53_004249 [Persea americana]|uniref:Uncharacterized protein n=1 Tax=Persea americana TaxID=3435 RepID=A0ACC2MAW1_PERAE|nr:hypothetical protein MRB53_004249 [Persea americana]